MKKIPIGELVLDYSLYPRHDIDSFTVNRLADALEAGEQLPPVIVCSESKRVIDGFHRVTVYHRLYRDEPGHPIDCDVKKYANDRERFADAWKLNARHGRALSNFDIATCIVKGRQFGMDEEMIVSVAAISAKKYKMLVENKLATVKGKDVAIKRTLHNYAGRELSMRIQGVNERAGGMQQRFYVNQVSDLVKNRAIDVDNVELVESLRMLASELSMFLASLNKQAV